MKLKISSVILVSLILDQLSKRMIEKIGSMNIFSFMDFTPVWNKGVSFSMFSEYSHIWINVGTVIIRMYVAYLLYISKKQWEKIALALIFGGALGNLIDRVLFGKVFDFIFLHYGSWKFAVFNIADVCISLGAFILFLEILGMFGKGKAIRSIDKPFSKFSK